MEFRAPKTQQEAEEAAQLLAKEMDNLSLQEHEQFLFDLHGLDQTHDEDPENVNGHVSQMKEHLSKILEKPAYQRALYFNKEYVTDPSFLLMFLRSDRFDAKRAAQRLVNHFEIKSMLFGSGEILGRDVRLSDLTDDDTTILESGYLQVLPRRDLAGRSVIFFSMVHRPKRDRLDSFNRSYWYIMNSALKDDETQKKGLVVVTYNVGLNARSDTDLILTQLDPVIQAVPKKIMGFHYCFSDSALQPYVTGLHLYLDKAIKGRFRAHFGEDSKFVLQTYGIPTTHQPVYPNGKLCLAWHREWLNVRRTQEENDGIVNGELVPRRFDVLFGRARGAREHTGNLRAIHIVELFQAQYEQANSIEKTDIANRIVAMIKESLGRFLRWEEQGWVEVSDVVAREKISHFFRHGRSKRTSRAESSTTKKSETALKRLTTSPSPSPENGCKRFEAEAPV